MTDPKPYASPACYAHETDPAYAGYLTADELLALLAEAHRHLARDADDRRRVLRAAIETALARLGGALPEPGDAPAAPNSLDRLRATLPRIADDAVHGLLKRALDSG